MNYIKTSLWINNTMGQHFEINNTSKCILRMGGEYSKFGRCKEFDLIMYTPQLEEKLVTIQECATKHEVDYLISYLQKVLYDKSQLKQQIQSLKKCKNDFSDSINNLRIELREKYFEVDLKNILENIST